DEQKASNQRIAYAQDQLDHFGSLHHADKTGENSEHAAFGAGGNESGWWRLGIEAAVAGAILSGEDAGLAFEAENRSVDVGLAGQNAGVVHEVTGGKVIGAVGDDVELAKEFEGIGAAESCVEGTEIQKRINAFQFVGGGIKFLAANVGCGMDNLALQ